MSSSDKVVPPKKSKAARKTEVLSDEPPVAESTEVQEQNGHVDDPGRVSDAASSSGQDQETPVNIFQQQVVEGKRKRNAPLAEQTLQDWLKKNFVEKENSFLLLNDMYQSYLEACSSVAAFAMDYTHFHKAVAQMFPKGQALVDDSPYKDTIREKKPKKKSATKIQADSLHLKMKDIIKEAITDLGNPRKGIGFSAIKNLVAGKFPALRVDLRVNILKNAIFRELRFGHIECVRGIGACGYYRLPRTPEQEAEEVEAEKKEAQEKALKKKGKKDATSSEEKTDENAEKTGDDESENVEKKDEEKPTETEETSQEKPAKKRKTKKRKKLQKDYNVTHSEPQHIEDTFALAMTYNSEPKEASVAKIRKYIKDFYKEEVSIEKLKKCLDTGVEHGFWFQVTGHGSGSGSFRLTINEFDPLADDNLTGKVMNAIVACTEPKQSSALLLKKYVQDYHPNFRVAERPHLFKMALQRAVNKNKIVQLSGIGASGTFQLVDPFLPSPTILQGKDTASDYGESDVGVIEDVQAFQDAYKPRPTKRRGMGRPGAAAVSRLDPSAIVSVPQMGSRASKSRGVKKPVAGRGSRTTSRRYASSSDEEENEDESSEEELPKKAAPSNKRKAPPTPSAAGKAKKAKVVASPVKKLPARKATAEAASAAKKTASESESEEYDSEPEAYTPRRSVSRGGARASADTGKTGRGEKGRSVPSPTRRAPVPTKGQKKGGKERLEKEEKEDSEEEKPQPSQKGKPAGKGRGTGKGKKTKKPAKKIPAKGKATEKSKSKGVAELAAFPTTPKSGTHASGRLASAARMRAQPPSEDDDEKKELSSSKLAKLPGLKVTVVLTPPKRGSVGSSKKGHKVTNVSPVVDAKTSDDEDEEAEKQEKAKKPKIEKAAAAGKKKKKKGGKKAKTRK